VFCLWKDQTQILGKSRLEKGWRRESSHFISAEAKCSGRRCGRWKILNDEENSLEARERDGKLWKIYTTECFCSLQKDIFRFYF
jgi:hypothetical protein